MKITISPDVFERIEEDSLRQAEEAVGKGTFEAAEGIGVLTLIKAGVMTQLNLMGMNIWNKLKTPRTLDELAEEIGREFEAPCDECRRDVQEFVDDLAAKGFLIYE